MLMETEMCVCDFGLAGFFFQSYFVHHPSCFERCEQKEGKPSLMPLIHKVTHIQLINRTIKRLSLAFCGFMWGGEIPHF